MEPEIWFGHVAIDAIPVGCDEPCDTWVWYEACCAVCTSELVGISPPTYSSKGFVEILLTHSDTVGHIQHRMDSIYLKSYFCVRNFFQNDDFYPLRARTFQVLSMPCSRRCSWVLDYSYDLALGFISSLFDGLYFRMTFLAPRCRVKGQINQSSVNDYDCELRKKTSKHSRR